MSRWAVWSVILAGAFLGGCPSQEISVPTNGAAWGALVVTIDTSKHVVLRGDTLQVSVTARNYGKEPVHIVARTGAPVYIRVWRTTPLGWEPVKRYPQAATMVMNPWTLEAKSERTFELNLTVEPDWPTNEPIRLTAELNGLEDVSPGIIIEAVSPPVVNE